MTELTLQEKVDRFKANEERLQKFINQTGGYDATTGVHVESIQDFLARLESDVDNKFSGLDQQIADFADRLDDLIFPIDPPAIPPPLPDDINVTQVNEVRNGTLTISLEVDWPDVDSNYAQYFDSYELQFNDGTNTYDAFSTTSRIRIHDVKVGAVYTGSIRVKNHKSVYGAWSTPKSYTVVADTTAPNNVTNLSVIEYDSSYITIGWTGSTSPDVLGYAIYLKKSTETTYVRVHDVLAGNLRDVIVGLNADTTYDIKVVTYDYWGNMSTGSTISQRTKTSYNPGPADPVDGDTLVLAALSQVDDKGNVIYGIKASWAAASGAAYYDVAIKEGTTSAAPASMSDAIAYAVNGSEYLWWNLRAGFHYSVRVKSYNGIGEDANWSAIKSVQIAADTTAPGLPTSISLLTGFKSILVSWTNPADSDLAGVEVYRSADNSTYVKVATVNALPGKQGGFGDNGLASNQVYYYKLKTFDWSGNLSNFTSPVNATTPLVDSIDIAEAAITDTQLAQDAKGVRRVDTLAGLTGLENGTIVYLTQDYTDPGGTLFTANKLYKYNGTAWKPVVDAADLSGQISAAQQQALYLTNNANAIKKVDVFAEFPTTGNYEGRIIYKTPENSLYKYTSGAWALGVTPVEITGQVTTDQISTNAVKESQIDDSAVTTRKLIIRDFSNLAENSDFELGNVGWTLTSGTGWAIVNETGYVGNYMAKRAIGAGPSSATFANNNTFTAKAGDSFYASCYVKLSAVGAASEFGVIAQFLDANGGVLATEAITNVSAPPTTPNYLDWTQLERVVTVPNNANIVRARVAIYVATQNSNTTVFVDQVYISRANAGKLIVDGTLEAGKIKANSITSTQIAASAITADELAANSVEAGKIAANAVTAGTIAAAVINARELAAGAITAEKLAIVPQGSALTEDPQTADATAWSVYGAGSFEIASITDGISGNTVLRNTTASTWIYSRKAAPLDKNKTYRVRVNARQAAGATGVFYLAVALQDANGNNITGDGTWWYYPQSGITLTTSFQAFTAQFGFGTAKTFPANAVTMRVGVIMNFNGSTTYMEVQDLRIEEAITATLIADGAITTGKIFADAITSDKIAANAVTASELAADSVIAGKIAAAAINAREIAAGAIQTSKLYVTDLTNLVENFEFAEPNATTTVLEASSRNWNANQYFLSNAANIPSNASKFGRGVARTSQAVTYYDKYIPVNPGEQWYITTWVSRKPTSDPTYPGSTQYIAAGYQWFNDAKTLQGTLIGATGSGASITPVSTLPDANTYSGPTGILVWNTTNNIPYIWNLENKTWTQTDTNGWVQLRSVVTVPTGCYYFRPTIALGAAGDSWFFTKVISRKGASGELIVDGTIQATKLVAGSITANLIAGDTITGDKIKTTTSLPGTITVGSTGVTIETVRTNAATGAQDPATRINAATTTIDPGKILISGTTTLSSWRNGTDATKIEGGSIAANTITANKISIGLRGLNFEGIEFTTGAKASNGTWPNKVYWSAGTISFIGDDGNTTTQAIAAESSGITWAAASGTVYIYWDKANTPGTLKTTNTRSTAYGADKVMVATYDGAANLTVSFGRTIIDGDKIITGSIVADKIDTRGLSIKDSNGNVILAAGTALNWNNITNQPTGIYNSNITVDANGILQGAGTSNVVVNNAQVQVGGTNILKNTSRWTNLSDWFSNGGGLEIDSTVTYAGYNTLKIPNSNGGIGSSIIRCESDTIYTVSAMVKASGNIGGGYDNGLHIQNWRDEDTGNVHQETGISADTDITTSWKLIQQTFKTVASATPGYIRFYFYPLAAGVSVNVAWVKIEKGNKATDWTPNPEEIRNTNISISANGTLSGGGGGQVTLSGVGFTGDTDAQRNSRITVDANGILQGTGTSNVVVNNSFLDTLTFGTTNVTVNGNVIKKTGGNQGNWDAQAYSRESYTLGAYASFSPDQTSGYMMAGLNTDPTTDASYSSIDYAWYMSNGTLVIYESGSYIDSYGGYSVGDILSVTYDGSYIRYYKNGSVQRSVQVSITNPLYFDSSIHDLNNSISKIKFGPMSSNNWNQITNQPAGIYNSNISINSNGSLSGAGGGSVTIGGLGYSGDLNATNGATVGTNVKDSNGNVASVNKVFNNLLDPGKWVLNQSGSHPGFGHNGRTDENQVIVDVGPDGAPHPIWWSYSQDGEASGGWNTDSVPVDHTKAYRFSCWIRMYGVMDGSVYLGVGGGQVNNLNGGINYNPYFHAYGRGNYVSGRWYLFVGYVWPSSYTGTDSRSKVYDGTTGAIVTSGTDYRWVSGNTGGQHRCYQYYTSNGAQQQFWAPRIDVLDGSEPTVDQLVAVGALSGRNRITTGTSSTYIDSLDANRIAAGSIAVGTIIKSSDNKFIIDFYNKYISITV